MSDRPTQTPASSAPQPQASGGSLAARAARFRNGSPFLVERATLYDPDPLDLPVAPADQRRSAPRTLLPAALTLLGVVVVVGLAAGILFVRNADGPRTAENEDRGQGRGQDRGMGRLGQFSERVPRSSPDAPSAETPARRDQVTYDLTRRSNDTIVGAWRAHKDVKYPPAGEAKPAAPEIVSPATETPPSGLKRLMPRRLTGWLAKRKTEQAAETAVPPRAPLDETHVPKVSTEFRPAPRPRAPLDEPYVPKASAEGQSARPAPAARDTASAPNRAPDPVRQRAAPGAAEQPGANVVARVGRATDPKERGTANADRDPALPIEPSDADKPTLDRERYAARRAQRGGFAPPCARRADWRSISTDSKCATRARCPMASSFPALRRSGRDDLSLMSPTAIPGALRNAFPAVFPAAY